MNFNAEEYKLEIKKLAKIILNTARVNDSDKFEEIYNALDKHEYTMFNGNSLTVLYHSHNHDAYFKSFLELYCTNSFNFYKKLCVAAMFQDIVEEFNAIFEKNYNTILILQEEYKASLNGGKDWSSAKSEELKEREQTEAEYKGR